MRCLETAHHAVLEQTLAAKVHSYTRSYTHTHTWETAHLDVLERNLAAKAIAYLDDGPTPRPA